MKFTFIFLIFISVGLGSCQVLPEETYKKIKLDRTAAPINEVKIIPFAKIEPNKYETLSLIPEDLTLSYNGNNRYDSEIISNYKTALLNITEPGNYIIEIESLVSLGIEGLIMVPMIELRDSKNSKIETTPLATELLKPSFTMPVRLKRTWSFNLETSTAPLIIIYADNTNRGGELGKSESFGYYGTLTYNVNTFKSNPTGKFRIKIEKQ